MLMHKQHNYKASYERTHEQLVDIWSALDTSLTLDDNGQPVFDGPALAGHLENANPEIWATIYCHALQAREDFYHEIHNMP